MADERSNAARKAWNTRKSPKYKADKTERASKDALSRWCESHGWKVIFFEGKTGAPRTGIVDAVIVRIRPGDSDAIEVYLIQLKAGAGGLTAIEISRLKKVVGRASLSWLLAAFDGDELHFLPGTP
jgi:hypothetical protein